MASFEVFVSKDTFKFNAAHFVAFRGFRERLHGHNYRVSVRLFGNRTIGLDGYLIDFGDVKAVTKDVCKRLNEHFLCPIYSDVLQINTIGQEGDNSQVTIGCEDGSQFVFPLSDCAMLPIVHATAEELSIYLYAEILNSLDARFLTEKRGIHTMEVVVAEAPGQEATFRLPIPVEEGEVKLDVRKFIMTGDLSPKPCPVIDPVPRPKACCSSCDERLRNQLESIAAALNNAKEGRTSNGDLTAEKLQKLLSLDD